MTRRLAYPEVDGRRAKDLREAILRDMAALAPDWRAVHEEAGADRALVEIAARFLEQTTVRLDKTPERDALAFLDFFDVPAPAPRSAEGVAVFALSEDATGSAQIDRRTPLDIPSAEGEAVRFETEEPLTIHAARITYLAAVDPGSDRIEVAPAATTAFERDAAAPEFYRLAASVAPEDNVIRLEYAAGLMPGNFLRFENPTSGEVRINTVLELGEDGLVTLTKPVGGAGIDIGDDEKIERMTWLDAFWDDMPNAQEHALYLGDDALLEVEEPAKFTLYIEGIDPEETFSPDAFVVELFGQREIDGGSEEDPDWHRLPLVSVNGDAHTFVKAWKGKVLPVEIAPDKVARWLRLRRLAPITPGDGVDRDQTPDLSVRQISLQAETDVPDISQGSVAVSQAVHNATPLPVTTEFLPFGPEPQRFDVFAMSAPETLTKAGALATFRFNLLDATLENLAASLRLDAKRRVYGVGSNGRMQVLEFRADENQFWQEAVGPESDGKNTRFEKIVRPVAAQLDGGGDLVVGAFKTDDGTLSLMTARISRAGTADDVTVTEWQPIPELSPPPDWSTTRALAVVPLKSDSIRAQMLYAGADGIKRLRFEGDGDRVDSDWKNVPAAFAPILDNTARLVPVPGSFEDDNGDVLVTDVAGTVWLLRFTNGAASWLQLQDNDAQSLVCAPGTMPVALAWQDDVPDRYFAVAVIQSDGKFRFAQFDDATPPAPVGQPRVEDVPNDSYLALVTGSILPTSSTSNDTRQPSLFVVAPQASPPRIEEWMFVDNNVGRVKVQQTIPRSVPAVEKSGDGLVAFSATASDHSLLLMPGSDETLIRVDIEPSRKVDLLSWIATERNPATEPFMVEYFVPGAGGAASIRIIINAWKVAHEVRDAPDGPLYYNGIRGDIDGGEAITILKTDLEWAGDYELDGTVPQLRYDKSLVSFGGGGSPSEVALVAQLAGGEVEIGRFTVKSITANVDDRLLRVADAEEQALIDLRSRANDDAMTLRTFAVGAGTHEVVASGSTDHYGTLARVLGANDTLTGVALPEDLNTVFSVESNVLVANGSDVATALLPAWQNSVPTISWSKAASNEFAQQVIVSEPLDRNYQGPALSWEYFDGEGWGRLDKGFSDETDNLVRSGNVSFQVPDDLKKVDIAGQEDFWIRARLIGGDYGRPRYVVDTTFDDEDNPVQQAVTVDTKHMRPPEVAAVGSFFGPTPEAPPAFVVARNNARDIDQSAANRLRSAAYPVFEGVHETPLDATGNSRAILLGLSQPLPQGVASLYVSAADQDAPAKLKIESLHPNLSWVEAPLIGRDPTHGLTRSGLIQFDNNTAMIPTNLLGQTLCWLRITTTDPGWHPRVLGLWLNGTRVIQAGTVLQELLGTSLGEPGTTFTLLKSPVVENSLELRIRERLGTEEIAQLRAASGGACEPVLENVPNIPGQWVLWHPTDTLQGKRGAREYLLGPNGTIQFGDGANGKIPPAIRDGVRAFRYQAGGVPFEAPAWTEVKPNVQIPQFDLGFVPEAIAGGTKQPTSAELVQRIPSALRHQSDAMSLADVEAIARDFDNQIVQVRALAPAHQGGPVRVFVLARGDGRMPNYGLARQEALASALGQKMTDAYPHQCLVVNSVTFREIKVRVALTPEPGGGVTLNAEAGTRLFLFFDPIDGGADGLGWPPGRAPVPLDVERALRGLVGLSSVGNISIEWLEPAMRGTPLQSGEVAVLADRAHLNLDIKEEGQA